MERGPAVTAELNPLPRLAQVSFRVTGQAAGPAARALGLDALPAAGRFGRGERLAVLWLGPDEFLAVSSVRDAADMARALEAAVPRDRGVVVDLSANRVGFELAGPTAREVLATCCAIDFHPRVFGPGGVVSTLIARAPVIIFQTDERPAYRILVRPSFATYVSDWLADGIAGLAQR